MPAVKAQTQARARRIAATVPLVGGFAGFDFGALTLLLQELIPLIISCFQPDDGPDAKQYVTRNWSSKQKDYGGYDKAVAFRAARAARRSAWRRGVRLTWAQGLTLGIATLDDIRKDADPGSMSAIIREHEGAVIPPDDDSDEADWNL